MSHHIVDFSKVSFSYPDGTMALRDITFRITHGEAVGIVGANGAGKSTILMQMNGFLLPSSGLITIGDHQLTKNTRQEIRKKVGVVFQDPDDQLFMPTVFEDIAFGPINLGLKPEVVEKRVQEAMEIAGCRLLRDKPPHHLSGGQKSAVAIASVLAMHPDILVMDEPASNLDPKSRRGLINMLRTFTHTKIVASHDLDLILDVCERCLVVREGRVVADGPVEQILTDKTLLEENNLELPLSLQKTGYNKPNKEDPMNDIEKLRHLLEHWAEHNIDHARNYAEWAERAKAQGKAELAEVLARITEETRNMDALFQKASALCR
jgi:cobalt/nickel transport system ATP-binding protein